MLRRRQRSVRCLTSRGKGFLQFNEYTLNGGQIV